MALSLLCALSSCASRATSSYKAARSIGAKLGCEFKAHTSNPQVRDGENVTDYGLPKPQDSGSCSRTGHTVLKIAIWHSAHERDSGFNAAFKKFCPQEQHFVTKSELNLAVGGKWSVTAESPSDARSIARILGGNARYLGC